MSVKLERTHRPPPKKNHLKTKEVNWLTGKNSHLYIDNKLHIYKAVMRPIWKYGMELWGWASKSNVVIMQRSQSKILRAVANALCYVTNHTVNTEFNIPYVSDVIHERINKHRNTLEEHPYPLLQPLLQPINSGRPKRCWPLTFRHRASSI